MDVSKITLEIRVNHTTQNTEVFLKGDRRPLFGVESASPTAYAEAWRYLASYAMERAFYAEQTDLRRHYTNDEHRKMALRVYEENKNIFERS